MSLSITPEQFNQLAKTYNRIPLAKTLLADLDTPVSAYLKLANQPYSYLFESVQGGEKWARYSIIGLPSRQTIHIRGTQITLQEQGEITESFAHADPLAWLEQYQADFNVAPLASHNQDELFTGGLVGFFGYDTVGLVEPKLRQQNPTDGLDTDDILLMVSEEVLVFDTLSGKIHMIVLADPSQAGAYAAAQTRLAEIQQQLQQPRPVLTRPAPVTLSEQDLHYSFNETDFTQAVDTIKDYIVEGDVMQVVLAQRMQLDFAHPPIDLYRALRSLNPSPYMFYVHLGDTQIVGSSPEILVRLEHGKVTVRPIAGTRKRGADAAEDSALEQELLADPKELAEHLMLIDLGRNDAGRVSQTGSVQMTEKMLIERYSHVMHIVSNVEGTLQKGKSAIDVLRATFPAGTVSGAPKIRAMEIIEELEPVKRGIYGGAVGYLGWHGNLDTAIAIRTAVIQNKKLYIQAGAGVVYDSQPDAEWEETMNKARAVIRAATLAANNFTE